MKKKIILFHCNNNNVKGIKFIIDGSEYHTFDIRHHPLWPDTLTIVNSIGTQSGPNNTCQKCMIDAKWNETEIEAELSYEEKDIYWFTQFKSPEFLKFEFI